jgi:hypothetical protein
MTGSPALGENRFRTTNDKGGVSVMPLIQVLLVLIVVGVLLWLVNTYVPMAGSIKSILNAVVVIVVVIWLLNVFGLMENITRLRVGK